MHFSLIKNQFQIIEKPLNFPNDFLMRVLPFADFKSLSLQFNFTFEIMQMTPRHVVDKIVKLPTQIAF